MKILVTGGAGFVGTNLLHHLVQKYPSYGLAALDNLSRGSKANLAELIKRPNFDFIDADITDEVRLQEIITALDPAIIINLVYTEAEPEFVKTFAYGSYVLLETARQHNPSLRKLIFLSSDEVYGETVNKEGALRPSLETDPLRPQTPLAAAQAGADLLAQSYYNRYQLPTTVLRVSNIFGPYQDEKRLMPLLINRALENKPLPLYGDGNHSRDWLCVQNLIELIDQVVHTENEEVTGEVFNVAGSVEYSVLEVSELILAQLGKSKDLIEFVEDERPHTLRRVLNGEKIERALDWQPESDFKEALSKTMEWYELEAGS